jgi:hypothetical protein
MGGYTGFRGNETADRFVTDVGALKTNTRSRTIHA